MHKEIPFTEYTKREYLRLELRCSPFHTIKKMEIIYGICSAFPNPF
jgi:hypothetical protein